MEDKWYDTIKSGKCLDERNLKALCEKVRIFFKSTGKRNPGRRVKCSACFGSSDNMRRYSWSIL